MRRTPRLFAPAKKITDSGIDFEGKCILGFMATFTIGGGLFVYPYAKSAALLLTSAVRDNPAICFAPSDNILPPPTTARMLGKR